MGPLEGIVEPTLAGMGYELVDAQASNHGRSLRIFIDRPEGITVDDCAEVSRQLSRVFAVEGVDYDRLEVSSPGLDRPLRKVADFVRFAGQKAEVRMRVPGADGRKRYTGTLKGVQDGVLTLDVDGAAVALALDGVDRAKLVPEF
ncbi:MAG: ribosome maturation factor RimP [Betaproteobacteria bacterium]|nr:ribosome maturation factor RimP [Betaproteobacteria bacterium]